MNGHFRKYDWVLRRQKFKITVFSKNKVNFIN